MSQAKGLKLVKGCGYSKRTIYIIDGSDKIQIGCTLYTKQDVIKAIEGSYRGQDQLDYIDKVNECYNSDVTPWSILKDDTDCRIRCEVARHGQYLEHLKDDNDWIVRCEVARQGQYLEQFKEDSIWRVRWEVARQGQYLGQFKYDEIYAVRLEVAKQGKYLEQLKDDEDYGVRDMALEMLNKTT